MRVKDIMTSKVVAVGLDDTLATVKDIFDNMKFHHLVVVEEGRLFGIVSDRDLLKALSPNLGTITETLKDTATLNKRVHQIMSRKPIKLHAEADIYAAVDLFNRERISCIPIVDDQDRPVGILSWRDIMKRLAQRRAEP